MALALAAAALVAVALLWELAAPRGTALAGRLRALSLEAARRERRAPEDEFDPGRALRAEQRARALLRSCVGEEEWAMYRDLGFVRAWGRGGRAAEYAYLIYPHKPIVAYLPQTGALLNEYCVVLAAARSRHAFGRLPDADDVLAKWMLLSADERGLLAQANMHLPGRQLDPDEVRRDLARLGQWERRRQRERFGASAGRGRGARAGGSTEALPGGPSRCAGAEHRRSERPVDGVAAP